MVSVRSRRFTRICVHRQDRQSGKPEHHRLHGLRIWCAGGNKARLCHPGRNLRLVILFQQAGRQGICSSRYASSCGISSTGDGVIIRACSRPRLRQAVLPSTVRIVHRPHGSYRPPAAMFPLMDLCQTGLPAASRCMTHAAR